ncbi:MAG TPA: hypothetical protein QGF58_20135 [Myxococcota bacterium]|nr:hypothetical protein [Myxococcota bacterium]
MEQRELLEALLDEAKELQVERDRGVGLCLTVLGVAEGRFPETATRAWRILGHMRLYDSDFASAQAAYETSLELAEALGDSTAATHARLGLG